MCERLGDFLLLSVRTSTVGFPNLVTKNLFEVSVEVQYPVDFCCQMSVVVQYSNLSFNGVNCC